MMWENQGDVEACKTAADSSGADAGLTAATDACVDLKDSL
jgi:hypothetical protein